MLNQLKRLAVIAVIASSIALLLICVALGESATKIYPGLRYPTPNELAAGIAESTGGSWRAVTINSFDGTPLAAWAFLPNKSKANGKAVIALHGLGDTRRGVLGHARMLMRHGYTVLTPDSRGHGSSGGEFITYGLLERKDTHAWVDWMDANLRPTTIYGLGESMGAAIILQSLPIEHRIRAAELMLHNTFEEIAYDRMALVGLDKFIYWPMLEPAFLYTRAKYGENFKLASPNEAIRQSTTPVLLICGTADRNIPPRHSEALHRAAPASTELWLIPGANHTLGFSTSPVEFEKRVVGWFDTH